MKHSDEIIQLSHVAIKLGGHYVHKDINLSIKRGEILGIVGGSGSGKTTVMREILGLTRPDRGEVHVFGKNLYQLAPDEQITIQKRWGVLFQRNALFSSLTTLENVMFPFIEHTNLNEKTIEKLAYLKILMTGLPSDAATKYPAELSGGMQKRAGLARALALDPEIVFLDEPTAGLDPHTASQFDELIMSLHRSMGLTIVMVTHDLDSLWTITDRVAFLGEGKVLAIDSIAKLSKTSNPSIKEFFGGPRGRAAAHIVDGRENQDG